MESIIIFSGSSLVMFLLMALFSRKVSSDLPHDRVQRSLGRNPTEKENNTNDKQTDKKNKQKLLHTFLHVFTSKNRNTEQKDQDLVAAGLKNWTKAEWKVLHYSAGFFCALVVAALSTLFSLPIFPKLYLAILGFLLAYSAPSFWLKSKIKKRKDEILRTLPDTLDLIMVSVEAGLGFDAAILKVVEKQKGVMAEEFHLVLQEIKIGKPRRDALRDMAKKNNVEDLSNVIASLVQADQLGISMGSVLRNQSDQIRQKRKQRAQEQAQKAPVKIMIPLVFFIFPSIFIIILGPAFIQIMDYFGN